MAEVTIQDLAKQLAELQETTKQHAETIGTQQKTIDAQGKQIAALKKENTALKDTLKEAEADTPTTPVVPEEAFEVYGKKYKFVCAAFIHPITKEKMTAVDALTAPEILAALVAGGSGLIKEVVGK